MVRFCSIPGDFGRQGVLAAALLLLASTGKALSEELRVFTVEDLNDWEFDAFPPPPPGRVVSVEYDISSPEHEKAIHIETRSLRNLSVTIENRGLGLVKSPYLRGPRGWDFRSLDAIADSITSDPRLTPEEKFLRVHEWKGLHVANVLGSSYAPYKNPDFSGNPLRILNQYGHAMCGQSTSTTNSLLLHIPPAKSMYGRAIRLGAHRVGEAYWNRAWHAFDTTPATGSVQWVYYDRDDRTIAPGWKHLIQNPDLVRRATALTGSSLDRYLASATGESFDEAREFPHWDFNYDLRPGESLTMHFDMRGRLDQTSARQDNSIMYRSYSDYGSAVFSYRPDFRTSTYRRHVAAEGNVMETPGGLVPVNPSRPSFVVLSSKSTWCFAGAEVKARFRTKGRVFLGSKKSPYDTTYSNTMAWEELSEKRKEYGGASIEGKMAYWVKFEFSGPGSGLQEAELSSEVQMSPWSMPALEGGVNRIRFTAESLGGSTVHVTHRFDDRSCFHHQERATGSYGRFIPIRVGGVLQQGSKLESDDYRKGAFWKRITLHPEEEIPVRLEVLKVSGEDSGRRVRTLADRKLRYGWYRFFWDGRDDAGAKLPVGMYAYRFLINGKIIHGERLYLFHELWPEPNPEPSTAGPTLSVRTGAVPSPAILVGHDNPGLERVIPDGEEFGYLWHIGQDARGAGAAAPPAGGVPGLHTAAGVLTYGEGRPNEGFLMGKVEAAPRAGESGALEEPSSLDSRGEIHPLTVKKLTGELKFRSRDRWKKTGPDSCSVSGLIPALPASWNPSWATVSVSVGGVMEEFQLDASGRASSARGSFRIQLARPGKGAGPDGTPFTLRLRGDWAEEWLDEGIGPDDDDVGAERDFVIEVLLDGTKHLTRVTAEVDSRAGKSARVRYREGR
ncbi:MAG TPA: hypothetical protein VMT52_05135 [Planctomycetota bacterium]|nr:hypothetical protein [Planctomycetota bacterium]